MAGTSTDSSDGDPQAAGRSPAPPWPPPSADQPPPHYPIGTPPPWPPPGARPPPWQDPAWSAPAPAPVRASAEFPDGRPPATVAQGWAWMAIAIAGFLVGQVIAAVLTLIVAAANGHLSDLAQLAARPVPPGWVVVAGLLGLWVGFVGSVVVASRRGGTGDVASDMGLRFRPIDFALGPAVGLVGQLLLLPLLYLPLEHVIPNLSHRLDQSAKRLTGGFPGADLAVIGVLTVLVVPVVEELVFRGLFLRGALRAFSRAGRVLGPTLAIVCTGLIFALAHFEPLEILGLAAFGMVLSFMAWRSGRLGPCITAHATFNLVALVAVAAVGPPH